MANAPSSSSDIEVDVLIVGAGPVGLTIAYQLLLFSSPFHNPSLPLSASSSSSALPGISLHIIEAHPKPVQDTFGRAAILFPRSMEILDSIGLADEMCQQCYAVRESVAYDKEGNEVHGRGAWKWVEGIEDTRFGFASALRQKYVEEILRRKIDEVGRGVVGVKSPARFEELVVDESVQEGEMGRVRAKVWDGEREEWYWVRCRYLIGCDGSRTKVRDAAGIESVGTRTEDKWVRIDGVLKSTTVPRPRCYGAFESPEYGNVLWIPLDHGATRIGFAFNEERRKLYKEESQEVYVKEAKLCVKPFEIEYERVDWASVYSVGQRIAKRFWANGCIFLAGDACHTHSSGAGQGMNAAMHDASNLGWKLALVLQGKAKRELLETYDLERRPIAEKLIRYDEDIAEMVSGRLPKNWKGDPKDDPNVALSAMLKAAKGFNTGLTLGYGSGLGVLAAAHPDTHNEGRNISIPAPATPGNRAPDVKLSSPGSWHEVWLHPLLPNRTQFHIVIFVGSGEGAKDLLKFFKENIGYDAERRGGSGRSQTNGSNEDQANGANGEAHKSISRHCRYLTILPKVVANGWHELGFDPLGKVYYDSDGSANNRYDTDRLTGTVFVIRPDTWIGARVNLSCEHAASTVRAYLQGILIS